MGNFVSVKQARLLVQTYQQMDPIDQPGAFEWAQTIVSLADALVDILANDLETSPERLDPKDVMRFHRPSYDILYRKGVEDA